MPNPKNVPTGAPPDQSALPLLRRIWSGHLGSLRLPPAEAAATEHMSIVIDAGDLGRVRIHYRRQRYRHYRNTRWMWAPERAEPAPDAELTPVHP